MDNSRRYGATFALYDAGQAALLAWVQTSPRLASARLKAGTVTPTVVAIFVPTLDEGEDADPFTTTSKTLLTRNTLPELLDHVEPPPLIPHFSPTDTPTADHCLYEVDPLSLNEMCKVVRQIRNSRASGDDGIPEEIYKTCLGSLGSGLHLASAKCEQARLSQIIRVRPFFFLCSTRETSVLIIDALA